MDSRSLLRHVRSFPPLIALLCGAVGAALVLQPATASARRGNQRSRRAMVTVIVTPGNPANRFVPANALGAGVDGHAKGETDRQLTRENIQAMLSAGFKTLTYRLRTELAIDAWHWNPQGSWSDPKGGQGYWTSDPTSASPIMVSYGYRLPRRGNTIDQGDNEGYSRLDDGDRDSFWKSNPYLDAQFTGESNALHPQWIVIELKKPEPVNGVRLLWGEPFATDYRIQYGSFDDVSDIDLNPAGMWRDFPRGVVRDGRGGEVMLRLSPGPVKTRWLRILMTQSSGAGRAGDRDVRDRLGFAVREVYAGLVDEQGEFHDQIRHGTDRRDQTIMHVSSTDPWHSDSDADPGVEQPGFDLVFQSGLTGNLPVLLPVGLLYDTPENAASEIRFLQSRGYKFNRVELGEEPDGQYITPEDFGALYLQWVDAIHGADPDLKIGGPSFQEILPDDEPRRVRLGNSAWLHRLLGYLERRGRLGDYSFFSFEWYPFDEVCEPPAPQLARAPRMLTNALREMQRRGLSRRIPWIISEYGYSAYSSRAELSIEGALLNADIVGRFLTLGGEQAFLYGYTPGTVGRDHDCTAGNNMLFLMDSAGHITHRVATYFGARLLTRAWVGQSDAWHEIYPAVSTAQNLKGDQLITAYALLRPDGLWSLLLINKDPEHAYQIQVRFRGLMAGSDAKFSGRLDLFQYSGAQYQLNSDPNKPYPIKADPPAYSVIENAQGRLFELPALSLTVIRGHVSR